MKQILKFMLSGFLIAVGIAVATAIDRGCNIGEYAYGTMLSGFGIGWGLYTAYQATKDGKP